MYGIINRAIEDLIVENYGRTTWDEIKMKSNVEVDLYLSNEPYDDDDTYKLAITASEVLKIPLGDVLFAFGEYWVLKTGKEKYGYLMDAGGANLKEFLVNLPNFHNRIMLLFPKLMPPEFKISDQKEDSLNVHYYSTRQGLATFVIGLLSGLSKMYSVETKIELIESRDNGHDHEVYKVSW